MSWTIAKVARMGKMILENRRVTICNSLAVWLCMTLGFRFHSNKEVEMAVREWLQMQKGNFEERHPRCVGSIRKEFLCVTHTVEHNYISPSSTIAIQLHVSALYVGHLQVVI